MNINIPAGIGEILDKLSILHIKLNKIKDNDKLKNVQNEYNILDNVVKDYIDTHISLNKNYIQLLEINNKLWKVEDNLREYERNNIFNEDFTINARSVYILNDKRSYWKKILNQEYNSQIIEEKSYECYDYNIENNTFNNKLRNFINSL